jgi:hypothetical protein
MCFHGVLLTHRGNFLKRRGRAVGNPVLVIKVNIFEKENNTLNNECGAPLWVYFMLKIYIELSAFFTGSKISLHNVIFFSVIVAITGVT